MASLILRAAARAASSAARAASRCAAAAARSGSGGAAASDPLMRASSVAAAATARSPASSGSVHPHIAARDTRSRLSDGSGSTIATSPPRFVEPDSVTFEADEKDLESDEALWALYERWCKFFNEERDRAEMARRFSFFKETVLAVEENKKSDLPYRLGINFMADGKLFEIYRRADSSHHYKRIPYSTSPVYGRAPDFLFKKDPKGLGQAANATEALKPSA